METKLNSLMTHKHTVSAVTAVTDSSTVWLILAMNYSLQRGCHQSDLAQWLLPWLSFRLKAPVRFWCSLTVCSVRTERNQASPQKLIQYTSAWKRTQVCNVFMRGHCAPHLVSVLPCHLWCHEIYKRDPKLATKALTLLLLRDQAHVIQ